MNRNLILNGQVSSSFTNVNGGIDVKGICTALQIDRAKLPQTIGIRRQTVAHYFNPQVRFIKLRSPESRKFFENLNQIYILVRAVMGEEVTIDQIVKWFHDPNKALGMKSPIELIGEKKTDVLIEKLMDVLNAAQGG